MELSGALPRPIRFAAYQRLLAEIDAVPEGSLSSINLDIPAAVSTALGALPEVALLAEGLGKLPDFCWRTFGRSPSAN